MKTEIESKIQLLQLLNKMDTDKSRCPKILMHVEGEGLKNCPNEVCTCFGSKYRTVIKTGVEQEDDEL